MSKSFGRTLAVDDVSLSVGPGVRPARAQRRRQDHSHAHLAPVAAPDQGHLALLGHDPAAEAGRLAVRRRLGYVPQEPGLHPGFSAFELVDYVAILKGMTGRRARHDEVRGGPGPGRPDRRVGPQDPQAVRLHAPATAFTVFAYAAIDTNISGPLGGAAAPWTTPRFRNRRWQPGRSRPTRWYRTTAQP